jgi:hypothetical protein
MALKLNVGLQKKIGLPEYSSAGASINIELELDSGLIGDPTRFQEAVNEAYEAARTALDDQVTRIMEAIPQRRLPSAEGHSEPARAPAESRDRRGSYETARRTAPPQRSEPPRSFSGGGRPDRVPQSGAGLWAWLKDMQEHEEGAEKIVDAVINWGKDQRIPGRIATWSREIVGDAHTFACRWLAGDQQDAREYS